MAKTVVREEKVEPKGRSLMEGSMVRRQRDCAEGAHEKLKSIMVHSHSTCKVVIRNYT